MKKLRGLLCAMAFVVLSVGVMPSAWSAWAGFTIITIAPENKAAPSWEIFLEGVCLAGPEVAELYQDIASFEYHSGTMVGTCVLPVPGL